MLQAQDAGTFASRVANLLERVEYRRADSREDKEAIFRMRYVAYAREGFIEPNSTGLFTDPDDERPNTWLISVRIDGELASSMRLHIASSPEHFLPVTAGFRDIISPLLEKGSLIVDASRQTSKFEFTRLIPFLPYITMRIAFVAQEYFGADYITAACRPEVQGPFRRMYPGSQTWAPPRPYPPLTRLQALMGYDCKAHWSAMRSRYPFLRSTPGEQRALFSRSSTSSADAYAELTAGRDARRSEARQNSTTSAA